jgi:hypothetical protein
MASQHKITHENPLGQHAQAPWMNNMQNVCTMNIKILFHPYNRLKVEMCCIVAQNLNSFKKKHIMHQCRISITHATPLLHCIHGSQPHGIEAMVCAKNFKG